MTPALEVVAEVDPLAAGVLGAIAEGVRRLALQRDAVGLAGVASETVAELASARRAHCWLFESESGLLWSADGAEHPADLGLAGHVARAGRPQSAPRADGDPRYARELDDPSGQGDERILVVPVGAAGEVHAVVVAVRESHAPPFEHADVEAVVVWARHVAPLFHLVHLTDAADDAAVIGPTTVYRDEALAHAAGADEHFAPLSVGSRWLAHAHWVAVAFVAAGVGFAACARVTEYASGPAWVVPTTRDVVSVRAGVVDTVVVHVGDPVKAGQILMTLSAEPERAELLRARAQLQRTLLGRLRSPGDRALERAVAEARAEVHHAEVLVDQASVRAPGAGVVGDLRIGPGRAVEAGVAVATLRDGVGGRPLVRAVVSGKHRPAIEVGEPFVLRLDGFAQAPQRLTVTAVSDRVGSADEIRGLLAPALGDGLGDDAWVVVEARLPGSVLATDGRDWTIHEGMVGRADIAVRRKPLLFVLLPVLERVFSHG